MSLTQAGGLLCAVAGGIWFFAESIPYIQETKTVRGPSAIQQVLVIGGTVLQVAVISLSKKRWSQP
jgi:hypothetical protein